MAVLEATPWNSIFGSLLSSSVLAGVVWQVTVSLPWKCRKVPEESQEEALHLANIPVGEHYKKEIMSGLDSISLPPNTVIQVLFNLWLPISTMNNNTFSLKELLYLNSKAAPRIWPTSTRSLGQWNVGQGIGFCTHSSNHKPRVFVKVKIIMKHYLHSTQQAQFCNCYKHEPQFKIIKKIKK